MCERGKLDQAIPVLELHLRRRRSRVPWVYAVYHRPWNAVAGRGRAKKVHGQLRRPLAGSRPFDSRESFNESL
jgi:hypothetical protein